MGFHPKSVVKYRQMAKEWEVLVARSVLREFRRKINSKNVRVNRATLENNNYKLRALDGICGNCQNLGIQISDNGNFRGVSLSCIKRHNPIELYASTPLGETAKCSDVGPK